MIVFRLDSRSGIPVYLQVVNQVRHALRLGLLDTGDQLPTVKEVVCQVAINPNTVLKAYRELEMEGLGRGAGGRRDLRAAPPTRTGSGNGGTAAPRPGQMAANGHGGRPGLPEH